MGVNNQLLFSVVGGLIIIICVRACVRACVCMRACVRACVCVCVCVNISLSSSSVSGYTATPNVPTLSRGETVGGPPIRKVAQGEGPRASGCCGSDGQALTR